MGITRVHPVNPLEISDWDARVGGFPSATFFHTTAWARVLHATYGYQPTYFTCVDADRYLSVLPVMEVDSWLTGRRGVSLPFTDECEPLCSGAGSFPDLFRAALDYAKTRRWKYLEARGGSLLLGNVTVSTEFYGHRLGLQDSESALFAQLGSAVKRAVRKAEQSGLTLEFSQDLAAMRTFHRLLGQTRRRHGVPVQPFKFFENIHTHVLAKKLGCVVLARLGDIPVAGAVFFHFGRTAIYKFGASDDSFQRLRANNLVMWEAIRWHAREGFSALDFGRTSFSNEGLRRFKLGWGAVERRIAYIRYDRRASCFVKRQDESSGWFNHIFRVLPVFLSRLIGAALYKHIA